MNHQVSFILRIVHLQEEKIALGDAGHEVEILPGERADPEERTPEK